MDPICAYANNNLIHLCLLVSDQSPNGIRDYEKWLASFTSPHTAHVQTRESQDQQQTSVIGQERTGNNLQLQ